MLSDKLLDLWNSKKFATSWIISGSNIDDIFSNIEIFSNKIMLAGDISLKNNPDFKTVRREDTKSITIEQVRKLQDFLSTTPAISEYKVAIIFEADLMNNHASNCCLKILEEPPKNSLLFLVTSDPSSLSATIKSRCHKINTGYELVNTISSSYEDFLDMILNANVSKKISYLKEISAKAKEEDWSNFCSNCLNLITRISKSNINCNISLSDKENQYITKTNILSKNPMLRLERISTIIRDEEAFDLDKKHIGIILLECLS